MMHLEHVALYVCDLEGIKDFFVEFFDAVPSALYHNPRTNFKSYFLRFDGGTRLEVMTRPELLTQNDTQMRTGYIHLAFKVGSNGEVDRITHLLEKKGYAIASGPRITGDGYYESQIVGIEGNIIEICA